MRFASLCFGVGVIGSPILLLPSQGPPIPIWAVFSQRFNLFIKK